MRDLSAASRVSPRANSDDGFTLIEVAVAAVLVVVFSLAFASSFSAAFGAARGNLLRQQATAVLNEELEYGRALDWPELAMSYVYTSAPMLNIAADSLDGAEAGFADYEVLAVFPYEGFISPLRIYVVDGQEYTVWRYVTHSALGMRRYVALIEWTDEGASETLLASTLISEVTARANTGGATTSTTLPPPTTTTTIPASTTTTVAASTTTTTVAASTTTTTIVSGPSLTIEAITISLGDNANIPEAQVFVDDEMGLNVNDATVYGEWSTSPAEAGYPFEVSALTGGNGRAIFQSSDDHAAGTIVQFCITDIVLVGYSYPGGVQCVAGVWG